MLNIHLSRRNLLQVGAISTLGLSLESVLRAEQSSSKATKAKQRANSVVLIFLGGGLSHHDSFDLKPDAPEEIRGKYKPIDSSLAGVKIGELLPLTAKLMHKVSLIRSGAHNNDHHETATNWVLSGRLGSAFGDYPAIGAVVAHEFGFSGKLPPYVSIPKNPSFTWELGKSAFLGGRYESFRAGDPNASDYKVQDVTPAEVLTERRIERRVKLLDAVDGLARKIENNDQIQTYDEFRQRASQMILSGEARKAFAIEEESDRLRDRYGRNTFGQSCLLARRLVQSGVRFVTINYGGWDHHGKIFEGLDRKLPELDKGYSALISDLTERGLLKDTLVLMMGEFGRTPKINKDAGRDHWGPAASLLFAGAGTKEGFVLGATDKHGAYTTKRPVAPADVAYTVFDSLGLDPRKMLTTPDGRPIEILDQGELIHELF
ncbi:MAG: DUF1501 domain-containing protein [Gemmataceae bacterium]|nr:DUF1501 domain-containing protein [Gemmataceae bacterium]